MLYGGKMQPAGQAVREWDGLRGDKGLEGLVWSCGRCAKRTAAGPDGAKRLRKHLTSRLMRSMTGGIALLKISKQALSDFSSLQTVTI